MAELEKKLQAAKVLGDDGATIAARLLREIQQLKEARWSNAKPSDRFEQALKAQQQAKREEEKAFDALAVAAERLMAANKAHMAAEEAHVRATSKHEGAKETSNRLARELLSADQGSPATAASVLEDIKRVLVSCKKAKWAKGGLAEALDALSGQLYDVEQRIDSESGEGEVGGEYSDCDSEKEDAELAARPPPPPSLCGKGGEGRGAPY